MIVVSDSGPLISLAKIGKFHILKYIFKKIIIPDGVYTEVVEEGKDRPGEKEIERALGKWIEKIKVSDHLAVQVLLSELKKGEAESIVLAKEVKADLILLDDKTARSIAESSELIAKGTVGILIIAKEIGIIKNFRTVINKLRGKGFYLKEDTYQRILREI